MMKKILWQFVCFFLLINSYGQYCLNDNRFTEDEYFSSNQIDSSMNIIYATVDNNQLALDMYYPNLSIDTISQRPFIFLVHGGGYVAGNRSLMRNTCFEFAKRGFVTATISHRYGSGLVTTLDPIYQAEQDAHAAMRYIVQNAGTYRIDTSWIFAGGESSGANIALSMAYTDQDDYDSLNASMSASHGGLYTSGNDLTNTYSIKGIYNNWGSVLAPSFDSLRNVSVISFHGEQDPIIDIDLNTMTFRGGSRWIYQAAKNFGHCNSLNIDSLGSHGVYLGLSGLTYRVTKASCFFKSVFCNSCSSDSTVDVIPPTCSITTSVNENTTNRLISVFPNPFQENINIEGLVGNEYFILSNVSGQTIYKGDDSDMLNRITLNSGIYFLLIEGSTGQQVVKLIKE